MSMRRRSLKAPHEGAEAAYGILAGYDGSARSEGALKWAVREARLRGTVLTVCNAYNPRFPVTSDESGVLDLGRRTGEWITAPGVRYATSVLGSGRARPLLVERPAAAVLCERGECADMVVVGCRGQGGNATLLLGSVSSQVAAQAGGRVVVVRGHWQPSAGYAPGPVAVEVDGSAASCDAAGFALEEAALHDAPLLAVCALG